LKIERIDTSTIKLDTTIFGIEKVTLLYIRIFDVKERADNMISTISNTSWINELDVIDKMTFESRAERTIEKLVSEIFKKVDDKVTVDFGEYLVSMSSQQALSEECLHSIVPLAELLKEKVVGNPGFDFHTETNSEYLAFGEAKYSGVDNPYTDALQQINKFIRLKKDKAELLELSKLVSPNAIENFLNDKKAFTAAFSLNAKRMEAIFKNVLSSEHLTPLLQYEELYLIGVEVVD
jgi:hypothetical protein